MVTGGPRGGQRDKIDRGLDYTGCVTLFRDTRVLTPKAMKDLLTDAAIGRYRGRILTEAKTNKRFAFGHGSA